MNKGVISLLLIFALVIIGLGISMFVGSSIPMWLLLGFAIIYSIERWYRVSYLRKKAIGRPYRFVLNISILFILGLLIYSGVKLFSGQFVNSGLFGSLIFIAEFIFFIYLWIIVSKNSWRWPSMKLTIFSLVCLSVIFAFAGVQPLASYKGNVIVSIEKWQEQKEVERIEEERLFAIEKAEEEERRQRELEVEKAQRDSASKTINVVETKRQQPSHIITEAKDYQVLFNEYRQQNGLPPLVFSDDLNKGAKSRLEELQITFSHNSHGGYNERLAENIVIGVYSDQRALSVWSNSFGHKANMLNSNYKHTGYAIGGGYAIQLFTSYSTINGKPQPPPGWYWSD